jgi:hypothetical protein
MHLGSRVIVYSLAMFARQGCDSERSIATDCENAAEEPIAGCLRFVLLSQNCSERAIRSSDC